MKPVIYGPAYSTYARTARLTLEEKGADYDLVPVDILKGEHKAPEHLARNPFGPVPAFAHDGITLYETSAIIRYIDRVMPGPPLQPTDAKAEARMNQTIGIIDSFAYQPIVWGLFVQRVLNPQMGGTTDEAKVEAALPAARLCLAELERLIAADRFVAGPEISLGDLFLAPVIAYLAQTPGGDELMAPHDGLRRWWGHMASRPSMAATAP